MNALIIFSTLVAAANAGIIAAPYAGAAAGLPYAGAAYPYAAYTQTGAIAGPIAPAYGDLVATPRGLRPLSLEGFSEDINQDGFVDPIGQVAYTAPAVSYAAYAFPAPAPGFGPPIIQNPGTAHFTRPINFYPSPTPIQN